jgi:hypothetical protein
MERVVTLVILEISTYNITLSLSVVYKVLKLKVS